MTVVAALRGERARDPRAIEPLLRRDRLYAAYALCHLEQPERCHCGLGWHGGEVVAGAVLYRGDAFDALTVAGEPGAVSLALRALGDTPRQCWLWARQEHLPHLADSLRVGSVTPMLRLAVTAQLFRPAGRVASVHRLGADDFGAVEHLYRHVPGTILRAEQLADGVYFGAVEDGELVAGAGTHGLSPRHRLAIVGNVLTHPRWRGQGLATACTSALVAELLRAHDDVVLNVAADNGPAHRVYSRLGFYLHCRLVEAQVGQMLWL